MTTQQRRGLHHCELHDLSQYLLFEAQLTISSALGKSDMAYRGTVRADERFALPALTNKYTSGVGAAQTNGAELVAACGSLGLSRFTPTIPHEVGPETYTDHISQTPFFHI